jgi:hypothetical protein
MATLTVLFLLVAVASFNVDGRVIKNKRQDSDDDQGDCDGMLMRCLAAFGSSYMSSDLTETILEDGLDDACPPFINIKSCFEEALRSCDDNHPHRQTVRSMVEIIRFVCEQEIRVLNANRQCLFGPQMAAALVTECPSHGLGHLCTLTADNECAFNLIGDRCNNPSLAAKIRDFVKKIQREAGCRTVRSVRKLLDEFIQI